MSYSADILVFNKSAIDRYKDLYPENVTINDMWKGHLWSRCYPDDYEFPKDEAPLWVYSPKVDLFNDFMKSQGLPFMHSGDIRVISEDTYFKFTKWLYKKLVDTTLIEVIDEDNFMYAKELINTYNKVHDMGINFDKEIVVFEHDW